MPKALRPDLFALNPKPKISVLEVGLGRNKVIIADHFYLHLDDILQAALELPFTDRFEIVGNFPGVRASLNVNTQPLIDHLSQIWGSNLLPFFSPQPIVFQGIKMQDFRLNVGQRQPHIDQDVTAMVYLNPEGFCNGGTGLYRHRPTELERVPIIPDTSIRQLADQLELSDEFFSSPEGYENFQNSMIFNPLFACRENQYINDGNAYWELLQLIEMKPNRLMIFDGRCFHSQYIQPGDYDQAFRVNQILYLRQESQPSPRPR